MAEKNQILEEQRKAREEFLKLKKMQNGEIDAGPKPSEIAIVPKTPKEKMQNFWFQYKWHTIGITALVIILAVFVTQCVTKEKYDMEIVCFTYTPVMDQQLNNAEKYFEEKISDLDGDGKVNLALVNCSISDSNENSQYRNTVLTKMQAIIASDEKALLFIVDEKAKEYFKNAFKGTEFFETEPINLSQEFYSETESEDFVSLPEGLQIACRKVEGTILEGEENVKKIYNEAQKVLEQIK